MAVKKWYVIVDKKTGRPYIDKNYGVPELWARKSEASIVIAQRELDDTKYHVAGKCLSDPT